MSYPVYNMMPVQSKLYMQSDTQVWQLQSRLTVQYVVDCAIEVADKCDFSKLQTASQNCGLEYVFAEVSPAMSDEEVEDRSAKRVKHKALSAGHIVWEVQEAGREEVIVLD